MSVLNLSYFRYSKKFLLLLVVWSLFCSCYISIVINSRQGFAYPAESKLFLLCGLHFHTFLVIFHTFYIILSLCVQNRISGRLFPIFHRFSKLQEGFSLVLGAVLSMFFRFVSENTNFSKSLRNTGHGDKNQGLRLEKSIKNTKT